MKKLNYFFAVLVVALAAIGCTGKAYQYADLKVHVNQKYVSNTGQVIDTVAWNENVYVYDQTTWDAKISGLTPNNGIVEGNELINVMSSTRQKTNNSGTCEFALWDEMFFYGEKNVSVYVTVERYIDGIYTVFYKEQKVAKKKKYEITLPTITLSQQVK